MYKEISKYYDKIFPLNKDKVSFVGNILKTQGKKILDIGCATGELAIELQKHGYKVSGLDIDDDMLEAARKKAKVENIAVDFISGNMLNLTEYFARDEFDLIICWGNTLPHLKNSDEVKQFIIQCCNVLKHGADLSIQIVNYEKVTQTEKFVMPEINNENIIFKRYYSFNEARNLIFNTKVTIKETGETFSNITIHYPVLRKDILSVMKDAGFNSINLFFGFNNKIFEESDISVIINAVKSS